MTPILVQATHQLLRGIDTNSGALVWQYDLGTFPFEVAIRGQRIFVAGHSLPEVHCVDYLTGRPLWRAPLAGLRHSRAYIVVGDDRVFVQRGDAIDCFSPDGARLWTNRYELAQQWVAMGVPDSVRNEAKT